MILCSILKGMEFIAFFGLSAMTDENKVIGEVLLHDVVQFLGMGPRNLWRGKETAEFARLNFHKSPPPYLQSFLSFGAPSGQNPAWQA